MGAPISAVIITFNEENNIERCIRSLEGIADEIIVVDSYSTDNTVEIAANLGATVYKQVFLGHVEQKNFALSKTSCPHVLSLDADEELSDKLRESILEVKENWNHDGYYFKRLTNYCGHWIKHTSWYPSKKLRLWDKSKGEWGGVNPHDKFILKKGSTKKFLKGDLLHFSYVNLEQHMRKIRLYSKISAESHFYKGNKTYVWNLLVNPAWRFLRDYIIKLGFIEGRDGLGICRISAYETYLKYKRILRLQHANRNLKGDICFFNGNKSWGGGEKWYFDIACRLIAHGYNVVAVANRNSELLLRFRLQKVPAFSITLSNLSFVDPICIIRLVRFFKHAGVKTVIINLSSDLKVAGFAAKLAGIERIIYRRGSAIPIKNSLLNRFIFKYIVTDVIANSEETRRTILKNNPNLFSRSEIQVIYNGIDPDDFERCQSQAIYRAVKDEFVIGNIGRLVQQKGQRYLIELARILKDNGHKFKILIGGDGPLRQELMNHALALNVHQEIIFLGFVKDVKAFMEQIDIFALTSLWEGFGYVIAEAMFCEKPVVAFNNSSNPELVKHGENGFLVPFPNIESFAKQVELLMNNKDMRNTMGKNAVNFINNSFTIDKTVERVESLINSKERAC
jgi:glycosyltransferase involved in cell wall biosynthesis